ncbi:hypothetical protein HII36_20935 [Nonomuraea sp. NN258]|uniref:hypothetical protein n=1 Tax=Nonomuraea antri TaxID=2730852 RepID=UPI001569FF99|nr:hypothetical protein [Nonomuraea antri]NRQ34298.1 hypothetical protein [Nonomuraea antri]
MSEPNTSAHWLSRDTRLRKSLEKLVLTELVSDEIQSASKDLAINQQRLKIISLSMLLDLPINEVPGYRAYKRALNQFNITVQEFIDRAPQDMHTGRLHRVAIWASATGFLMLILGGLLSIWLTFFSSVRDLGLMALLLAGLAMGAKHALSHERGVSTLLKIYDHDAAADLRKTRATLVNGVHTSGLIIRLLRLAINEAREDRLTQQFAVTSSPGLSDLHGTTYYVSTSAYDRVDELVEMLQGGSIGIAGQRGAGKSALIRAYCRAENLNYQSDVCCLVSAPVDYVAREFVLYLFAVLCRAVHSRFRQPRRSWRQRQTAWKRQVSWNKRLLWLVADTIYGLSVFTFKLLWTVALLLIGFYANLTPFLSFAAIILGLSVVIWTTYRDVRNIMVREISFRTERRLRSRAKRNLKRIRYLQTRTSGWSGGLKLGIGLEVQASHGYANAEQPYTYPELVREFRAFTETVGRHLRRTDDQLFIGVDELDKIGSGEQVERFLNEIKSVFGIPNVYFFVSVSDDALMAFERRGFPLRDVFDSAFDEIVRVAPLTYAESRRLLYERVIGLTEPYVALCHVLSGGLARDLIRMARQVIRIGSERSSLAEISERIARDEIYGKTVAALTNPAAKDATVLLRQLHCLAHDIRTAMPIENLLDELNSSSEDETETTRALRRELATYVYFCLTVSDVFDQKLANHNVAKATDDEAYPATFNYMASARLAFGVNPELAARLIDDFRYSWGLHVPGYLA